MPKEAYRQSNDNQTTIKCFDYLMSKLSNNLIGGSEIRIFILTHFFEVSA